MTVTNDDEMAMHGIMCSRGCDYGAFFYDMFRFIAFKFNTRQRFFHIQPSGFTPYIGEALVKIMRENPDYVLQARVRQAVAEWGCMQDAIEQCLRIGAPILNPYQSLLVDNNPKNYLRFFAKMCEAWKTLQDMGKPHLTSHVHSYGLQLMDRYVFLHPPESSLDATARQILRIPIT